MKSGWIVWLTVASAFAITQARAAEPEKQVQCEIRVLRVSDECFEKLCKCATIRAKPTCCDQSACCAKSACCEKTTCGEKASCGEKSNCCEKPACCPKSCCETTQKSCRSLPATMPACMVKVVMEAVQSDSSCNVMCCPRVMTLNGQSACVQVGEKSFFTTGIQSVNFGGQATEFPINEALSTGYRMTVRPTVAPDGRSVIMSVNCELTELDRNPAPLFPITTVITPTFEGGARGQPIPFTQFIQQPSLTTRGAHRFAVCGDGQTMVLDCGRTTRVRETDTSVPFLSDLPVVGELFQSKGSEVVSDRLVVFVTPCVCAGDAGEECTLPAPKVCEELPLFAQPAMCEPELLPVAPRPMCAPPCVFPCAPTACPAVAAFTQATPVPTPQAPPPGGGFGFVMVKPCAIAPPASACPVGAPAAAQGCWVAAPVSPAVAGGPAPACMATPVRMVRAVAAIAPCSGNDLPLVNLMIEYHEAGAAGDRAKARNLAAKCIALDPMCFSR